MTESGIYIKRDMKVRIAFNYCYSVYDITLSIYKVIKKFGNKYFMSTIRLGIYDTEKRVYRFTDTIENLTLDIIDSLSPNEIFMVNIPDVLYVEFIRNSNKCFEWADNNDVDIYICPEQILDITTINLLESIICGNYGSTHEYRHINVAYLTCNGSSIDMRDYFKEILLPKAEYINIVQKDLDNPIPCIKSENIKLFIIDDSNILNLDNMDIVYEDDGKKVTENYITKYTKERYLDINVANEDVTQFVNAIEKYIIVKEKKELEYNNNFLEDRVLTGLPDNTSTEKPDENDNKDKEPEIKAYIIDNCYTIVGSSSQANQVLEEYKEFFDENRIWNKVDSSNNSIETNFMKLDVVVDIDDKGNNNNIIHDKFDILNEKFIPCNPPLGHDKFEVVTSRMNNYYNTFVDRYKDYKTTSIKPVHIIYQVYDEFTLNKIVDYIEKELDKNNIEYETEDIELRTNSSTNKGTIFQFACIDFIVSIIDRDIMNQYNFHDYVDIRHDFEEGAIYSGKDHLSISNTDYAEELELAINMIDYIDNNKTEFMNNTDDIVHGLREGSNTEDDIENIVINLSMKDDCDIEGPIQDIKKLLSSREDIKSFQIGKVLMLK